MKTKSILALFCTLVVVIALFMLMGDIVHFKANALQTADCVVCERGTFGFNCISQQPSGGMWCKISDGGSTCELKLPCGQ